MYVPAHFKEDRVAVLHDAIRQYGFGTLVTSSEQELEASHLPMLLDPEPAPLGTVLGHLARANQLAARVLLGMSGAAAQRLAMIRLQELDALAEGAAASAVPRWEQQPRVWQQLLRAARRGQAPQLRAAQLRGLQLLAAGCGGEPGSC